MHNRSEQREEALKMSYRVYLSFSGDRPLKSYDEWLKS